MLTTNFTAPVNGALTVGQRLGDDHGAAAQAPTVDVQNARQVATFAGEQIRELPTTRNIRSILTLTPGLTNTGLGADCVGGVGVWCNNNIYNLSAHTATNDTDGGAQGRVMVDGTNINTGGGAGIMGMTGGYVADVANAQEVSVQISGALGESETGGASINIIPRTGGNRFTGNYFLTYTQGDFNTNGDVRDGAVVRRFVVLEEQRRSSRDQQRLSAHPRLRHVRRVWRTDQTRPPVVLLGGARLAERRVEPAAGPHLGQRERRHLGPELPGGSVVPAAAVDEHDAQRERAPHVSGDAKNKFNFFWDEGLTCQDPCDGSVAPWTARDGWWSGQVHPARLMQVGWTNPLTNVILLEAGLSVNRQLYDFSQHRYYTPNPDIPRVIEFGTTVGATSRLSHPQRHELHHQRCALGTVVRRYRRCGGAATAQRLAPARRRSRTSPAHTPPSSATTAATSRRLGPTEPATRASSTATTRRRWPASPPRLRRVPVRQHEPLLPERSAQPGAPTGAHASHNQHGPVHHR